MLTADIVLFRFHKNELQTLLIERRNDPFANYMALPGGYVNESETAKEAAYRELLEETNIKQTELNQLFTATDPERDPRGWTVSVVFTGFCEPYVKIIAGDDAKKALWIRINNVPKLAFDHLMLLKKAANNLKQRMYFSVFGGELLPKSFSLKDLYKLYLNIDDNHKKIEETVKRLCDFNILIKSGNMWFFEQSQYSLIQENGFFK